MFRLPKAADALLSPLSIAFTAPTFQRVLALFVGWVLTPGRHTVCAGLRVAGALSEGHYSSFHRIFSRAPFGLWPLARVLASMVLERVPQGQPVVCVVDDTTPQHKGKRVWGKGRHRDGCRSTRTHTVWVFGHKWVVLTVNVKFAFAARPWALPVLAALYLAPEVSRRQGKRHRTPADLARGLVLKLLRWFPDRRFILLGDGGYSSHELARFCRRFRTRLTLVGLCHPQVNLYGPPPVRRPGQNGRPRLKGQKMAAPKDVVAEAERKRATVGWYGGKRRRVEFVSGTGHWYKGGGGLVPVRWAFVHDRDGTHEDRYFYSTDPGLSPARIVTLYTARWGIEVTFQEVRRYLGFGTPRNRTKNSVLRTAPSLLGVFSLVCLIYHRHTGGKGAAAAGDAWYAKAEPTFGDAIAHVRRLLWAETVLKEVDPHGGVTKLRAKIRDVLLDQLCRAA